MKVKISDIEIGERQRINLGDLRDLDSMAEVGQLNAIGLRPLVVKDGVVTRWELVDGRRRLTWAAQHGWVEVEAVDRGHLTPLQKQEIELVEDIARKDRDWQEKCLAVAKLFSMKKLERMEIGEPWTIRIMAAFTNESKTNVGYMLQVADEIKKAPDGPVAKAGSYTDAVKQLFLKSYQEANAELEGRRQAAALEATETEDEEANSGLVQFSDNTEGEDEGPVVEKTKVYLHGIPCSFLEAVPGKDFSFETAHCVLGECLSNKELDRVVDLLRPNGYGVVWYDQYENWSDAFRVLDEEKGVYVMPYPLIWNTMRASTSYWPFSDSYRLGIVFSKTMREWEKDAIGAVISVPANEDNSIPSSVVDFALSGACPPNMAVFCVNNAPVTAVAETGRIPIWFEPDPLQFESKKAALRSFYEENMPNIEVCEK